MLINFGEIMNYEGGLSSARQKIEARLKNLRESGKEFERTYKPKQPTEKELKEMAEPYKIIRDRERMIREKERAARELGIILG